MGNGAWDASLPQPDQPGKLCRASPGCLYQRSAGRTHEGLNEAAIAAGTAVAVGWRDGPAVWEDRGCCSPFPNRSSRWPRQARRARRLQLLPQPALSQAPGRGPRAQWLADRQAELLPVPYFHVVFTMPAPIAAIAFQDKAVVHSILFSAAAEAGQRLRIRLDMTTLAANPRRLGARIGVLAVLHTPSCTPGGMR
jgi:hypothetical protein